MRQSLAIVAMSILAAVLFGIVHDQITVRICLEYFTIAHPPVFPTQDPTLLALGWGVIATWWVGLLLGLPLAFAARFGSAPKRDASSLVRPLGTLMLIAGCCAFLAGIAGRMAAASGVVFVPQSQGIPPDQHINFLTDAWAHLASYAAGFVGGITLCVLIWRSRQCLRKAPAVDSAADFSGAANPSRL